VEFIPCDALHAGAVHDYPSSTFKHTCDHHRLHRSASTVLTATGHVNGKW